LALPAWTPSQTKGQRGLGRRVQNWQDEVQPLS